MFSPRPSRHIWNASMEQGQDVRAGLQASSCRLPCHWPSTEYVIAGWPYDEGLDHHGTALCTL
ncbi:predicted protein [Plenodomus lingam JN3]|uniref:Predicted protein n=1 Tax=Leptosphaeria maculans (strain JN3 / isolate v23.1.3 / race Av1-4-5-6-7-8) TaxID=985895 RepID=E5ACQ6_LEPMJ|nr:predicted protein [Plenodomus lingam JN3]CBY02258.1 predicted protein [Plenodomus lingam JN3]